MKEIYVDRFGVAHEGELAELVKELETTIEIMDEMEKLQDSIDEARRRQSKGGDKMKSKFYTVEDNVTFVNFKKEDSKLTRRAKIINKIVTSRSEAVLTKPDNYVWAGAVGLIQGLKYKGDLKTGIKGAVGGLSTILAVDVLANIAVNKDEIKDA